MGRTGSSGGRELEHKPWLHQFGLEVGDGAWACNGQPAVALSDVALDFTIIYREGTLRSNVAKRPAQAHALASYKLLEVANRLFYSVQFEIAYTPEKSPSATMNPQTIEAACEIYRGSQGRLRDTAGIQWALNPWNSPTINVWRPGPRGNGAWEAVRTDFPIQPSVRYRCDIDLTYGSSSVGSVALYYSPFPFVWEQIGAWQSYARRDMSPDGWDDQDAWWVTVENISCSPDCAAGIGFKHENSWHWPIIDVT